MISDVSHQILSSLLYWNDGRYDVTNLAQALKNSDGLKGLMTGSRWINTVEFNMIRRRSQEGGGSTCLLGHCNISKGLRLFAKNGNQSNPSSIAQFEDPSGTLDNSIVSQPRRSCDPDRGLEKRGADAIQLRWWIFIIIGKYLRPWRAAWAYWNFGAHWLIFSQTNHKLINGIKVFRFSKTLFISDVADVVTGEKGEGFNSFFV